MSETSQNNKDLSFSHSQSSNKNSSSKPTEKNPLSAPDYPPAPSGSQAMPYKRDGFTSKSKQG
jgi:hypothetical protein